MNAITVGYTTARNTPHYPSTTKPHHSACGRRLTITTERTIARTSICQICRATVGEPVTIVPATGICTSCGDHVTLNDDAAIEPHQALHPRTSRWIACDGSNQPAEHRRQPRYQMAVAA
ncbi:hypothetical protein [Polymorphospora lycopeni]|uniref:C2H2-type domain-containing protein n=1 Tax=Polymorphospora lycopeni TaxID=3140240 RepID=A0ABV5CKS2_9ACTN